MFAFFLKRLALVIPTFIGITLLAFSLIHLIPGDPVQVMAGERRLDPTFYAETLKRLGLDRPLYEQYGAYLWKALHLDLGESFVTHESVWSEFLKLFPATVELALFAMLLATVFGLLAGVVAALNRGGLLDHGVMGLSLTGFSMPIFWWGLLLIMFVGERWGLTPVSGRIDLIKYYFEPVTGFMVIDAWLSGQAGAVKDALHHLVLPGIVLGTIPLAVIARMTRSSMLEVLSEDYVRTARAKGLPAWRVIGLHALRNAMIPVITVIGLQVGTLMAGAVLTETIFSWPGVGKWLIESIGRRDYPALQGGVMLISTLVILVNLAVDLTYGLINPRIRHA